MEPKKYEHICDNCDKTFEADKEELIGLEKLCDDCFEGYAHFMYVDGKRD